MEHQKALPDHDIHRVKEDTELFKQFMDNEGLQGHRNENVVRPHLWRSETLDVQTCVPGIAAMPTMKRTLSHAAVSQ